MQVQAESLAMTHLAGQPLDPPWIELKLAAAVDTDEVVVQVVLSLSR